jgi:hypothetical protein
MSFLIKAHYIMNVNLLADGFDFIVDVDFAAKEILI